MSDDKEKVIVKAADFDPADLTKSFNDAIAAQKAGDDQDFATALQGIKKVVDAALGEDDKADPADPKDQEKPDPFEAVNQKYAKKEGA